MKKIYENNIQDIKNIKEDLIKYKDIAVWKQEKIL